MLWLKGAASKPSWQRLLAASHKSNLLVASSVGMSVAIGVQAYAHSYRHNGRDDDIGIYIYRGLDDSAPPLVASSSSSTLGSSSTGRSGW